MSQVKIVHKTVYFVLADEEEWEDEEESESSSDDLTATDAQTADITDTMDFQVIYQQ